MEERGAAPDLGSKAWRGGQLLAAGTVVERLLRLGRNMLLARIIVPDDFALMAITLAVIALFGAITEVGVAQAVIQNERGSTREFLNVAWWFGVIRGVLVAAMALLLAAPIARFYGNPQLESLLLVAPLIIVFQGLASPRVYALQRQFRFGATLWTTQGAGLVGTLATAVLGILWQNVWALVLGAVIEAFARFVLSFILCPVRPSLRWDGRSTRELWTFSKGMAGLPVMTLLIMQADVFVLGRVVSGEMLGYYTLAIGLAGFPLMLFSKVVQPLVVPILANFQSDDAGMRGQLLGITRLVWLFGLPLTAVMGIVAPQLLTLFYGEPFAAAATAFAIYSMFTIVYMASMVSFSVYLAIARPELQRRFTIVRAVLVVAGLYPLSVWLGIEGAALTMLLAMLVAMVVQLFNLRRIIGLGIGSYVATMGTGLLAALVVAVPCVVVAQFTPWAFWAQALVCAALGAMAWGVLLLRERRTMTQLRGAAGARTNTRVEERL